VVLEQHSSHLTPMGERHETLQPATKHGKKLPIAPKKKPKNLAVTHQYSSGKQGEHLLCNEGKKKGTRKREGMMVDRKEKNIHQEDLVINVIPTRYLGSE